MMKGIANPQLKSGGLQIRWNEGPLRSLFFKKNLIKTEKTCLKQNI